MQLSDKQKAILADFGHDPEMDAAEGKALIDAIAKNQWRNPGDTTPKEYPTGGPCSRKQAELLRKYKYDPAEFTFEAASAKIDEIAKNDWKRPEADGPPATEDDFGTI